jgi:hypothetical protein
MAYTVSEYNHPTPITYAAEGFPMIAAFGAFQRWDGIFTFAYCHNDRFEPSHLTSFFDIKCEPSRLVHSPACAALFMRGDAAPAKRTLTVPISVQSARNQLRRTLDPWKINAIEMGIDPRQVLGHAVAIDLAAVDADSAGTPLPPAEGTTTYVSDTGELRWDVSQRGGGYFVADTPRTKLFTGFIRRREFDLGSGIRLAVGKTELDWATITLTVIDGESFDKPCRILIAATGVVKNSGAELEQLGGDRVTLSDRWGHEPVLCEGIPATITLPPSANRVRFYPLDEHGNRRDGVPVAANSDKTTIPLDPQHKTIWYEVEIR